MSVKTANGNHQFADGQDTIDLDVALITAPLTLTSATQAIQFVAGSNAYITKVDLRPFRQVRLLGRVPTVSASANSPKIQLKYNTSFSTTTGDYADLGDSSVEFSVFTGTDANIQDSGWITLKRGARIENCFLAVLSVGGNGSASPVISMVRAQFR